MGSPVRRLLQARLRTILIVSGAAVAVLAAGAFALVSADGPAESAQAAQTAPQTSDPLAGRPREEPTRASRGKTRSPEPSPSKTPKKKSSKSDSQAAHLAKPEKKKHYKVVKSGSCKASFYGEGQMTASGEAFDPSELTAAHKTLPMGSKVRVTNKNNDKSVIVRINDRGPYAGGRCLDLSTAAMKKVGGTGAGIIPVRYEVLSRG
ncbi:septal ring lytic transglycosylase RlpA family protein [Actinomadura darangshiensis]|uniref:Probable endolytic peptidoglycan transglycosylase RlpA n=1 Tax=Actinomadura darangshiensis TaxID=705336 RepID=A0A4R5BE27_9ACTN|nr:septal ring lytic transglycosylase RlpA family protein [Actinomadura darangshiensis]TDD81842.1 septal ring lytic transglycosylase RlpA family protein [Actinomadura darangshiensis]